MKNCFACFPLLLLGLVGCATNRALVPGIYLETRGPQVALFSVKELRLLPDHKFKYIQWTDMVGVGNQGGGTYRLRGQQLQLAFDGRSLAQSAVIKAQPLAPPPTADSVAVTVELHDGSTPLDGLTVLATSESGQVLTGASSDANGQARLRVARRQHPYQLRISGVGLQPIRQDWPLTSTAYRIQPAAQLGSAYQAGTVVRFQLLRQTATELLVRQGIDTITLALSARR